MIYIIRHSTAAHCNKEHKKWNIFWKENVNTINPHSYNEYDNLGLCCDFMNVHVHAQASVWSLRMRMHTNMHIHNYTFLINYKETINTGNLNTNKIKILQTLNYSMILGV
jgi:hypothetical protein